MKYLGYFLVALPLGAIFLAITYEVGFWPTAGLFALAGAMVASVAIGVSLIDQGQ
jgi:hypothetical protein